MAAISKNHEKISFEVTENLGLYEQFEEIIKLVSPINRNYGKSKIQKLYDQRTLAQEIREQKEKAIVKSVLLFGNIN